MTRQFGRFEILKKIATGGMAEIHVAKMEGVEGFEKLVVIKLLLEELAEDRQFVQMFLNEARLASRLNHPNVVQIYDLGVSDGEYYIAMEFIHGESLYKLAKSRRKQKKLVPLQYTLRVASQVCEGLHYAHTKADVHGNPMNIVHCDVSPQNILISFEGLVKVVDFGIAKATTVYDDTKPGQIKGKLNYLSPEQVRGKQLDGRSDVFSMGIVLWEMLTGRSLFQRSQKEETLKAILNGTITSTRQINRHVPEELDNIVLRALEVDPDRRFPTALEMGQAIEAFALKKELTATAFDLKDFMQQQFPDQKEKLQKIAEIQASGKNLEAMLFDDLNLDVQGLSGEVSGEISGEISGLSSQLFTPSQPLGPLTKPQDRFVYFRKIDRQPRRWPWVLAIILLLALGAGGYFFYPQILAFLGFEGEEPVERTGKGRMWVSSEPAGATVFLDGKRMGVTPLDLPGIHASGPRRVKVSLRGYKPWEKKIAFTDSDQIQEIDARLIRVQRVKWGSIGVVTEPPGANVLLDNEIIGGKTPLTIRQVAPGRAHKLEVTLAGHKDWVKTFKIKAGEERKLKGILPRSGDTRHASLSLDSTPAAIVFLGNDKLGPTPLEDREIPAGRHTLRLHSNDLQTSEYLIVDAEEGEAIEKKIEFRKGTIKVDASPWAHVYHKGKKLGTTPFVADLYIGSYRLDFRNPNLKWSKTRKIDIIAGKTAKLSVDMKKPEQ